MTHYSREQNLDAYYAPSRTTAYGAHTVADVRFALDAYDPWHRSHREFYGRATFGTYDDDRGEWCELWGLAEQKVREWSSALYLIDDGEHVRPMYVACYRAAMTHPHPFDGEHPSHLVLVDMPTGPRFATWALGPRRVYHVKVSSRRTLSAPIAD